MPRQVCERADVDISHMMYPHYHDKYRAIISQGYESITVVEKRVGETPGRFLLFSKFFGHCYTLCYRWLLVEQTIN